MRFCISGYGSIAGVHRDALIQIPGVEIDSVVGRLIDPAREFAEGCGASFATVDMGEALQRPGLDAVLIASPSSAHFRTGKTGSWRRQGRAGRDSHGGFVRRGRGTLRVGRREQRDC